MDPLSYLIHLESYREILAVLQPGQLAAVALRLEDLTYPEIGALLGITASAVGERVRAARRRVLEHRPDLATAMAGRKAKARRPWLGLTDWERQVMAGVLALEGAGGLAYGTAIAEHLGRPVPDVCRVLRRLEDRGLVKRGQALKLFKGGRAVGLVVPYTLVGP